MRKLTSLLIVLMMLIGLFNGLTALAAVSDGTFEGSAMGNNDNVTASVTFKDGAIENIEATHAETAGLGDVAISKVIESIIANQSVAVDVISGATNSSRALISAVSEAILAGGGNPDDYMSEAAAAPVEAAQDLTADVVIVGAGGAGMSAALSAAEAGAARVIIVEKMATTGGNTVRSTGGLNAAATPEQDEIEFAEGAGVEKTLQAAKDGYGEALKDLIDQVEAQWTAYQANPEGYFDTPELFMLDTLVGGLNVNDHALVAKLANDSADAIRWLDSIGASLPSVGAFGGASVKRIHRPVGEDGKTLSVGSFLVPILTKNSEDNGAIDILYDARATEILIADGAVTGIRCTSPGGEFTITADAVVMATGGFGANEDMYTQYQPQLKGYVSTNAPCATGDGIAMGEAIGAALVDMAQIQIHPTVHQATSSLITEGLRGDGAILVNQDGVRFFDEVSTRDKVSAAEIAQPGSYAYLIIDQKMVDASSVIAGYIKSGLTESGDDVATLAAAIGVDGATLAQTLEDWNASVAAGVDAAFGRTSFANPLDQGPFYAIKVAPGVHHTMGGLKINDEAEVIDVNGAVIPGLFAAGEVAGGVHGANRLGGNAVADIVVFGRIAGTNAAAYALAELDQAA